MFSFKGWRILLYLDSKKLQVWKIILIFLSAEIFFAFLVIRTLDQELDPDPHPDMHWPKILDPEPHWNQCFYFRSTLDPRLTKMFLCPTSCVPLMSCRRRWISSCATLSTELVSSPDKFYTVLKLNPNYWRLLLLKHENCRKNLFFLKL